MIRKKIFGNTNFQAEKQIHKYIPGSNQPSTLSNGTHFTDRKRAQLK